MPVPWRSAGLLRVIELDANADEELGDAYGVGQADNVVGGVVIDGAGVNRVDFPNAFACGSE